MASPVYPVDLRVSGRKFADSAVTIRVLPECSMIDGWILARAVRYALQNGHQ
jgi:hypothetical protein